MTTGDMEIRTALARGVANSVGQESFELWFDAGDALVVEGGRLVVQANSQFKLDRIRSGFRDVLVEVARDVLKGDPGLDFRLVANSVAAPPTGPTQPQDAHRADETRATNGDGASSRRRFANLRTFVAGEGNRLAMTSCEMIVDRPGEITPLFLYGPPGVGKSHLLEGIWSAMRARRQFSRVVYLSAEQFTSYFLDALKNSGLPSFRRKYRGADLLIIDDIQFFAGKKATVNELQHTVDDMLRGGRQLVLAADRPPGQLTQLGDGLVARLSSGMVCAMKPAERQTRLAIARQLATARRLEIPRAALEFVADQFPGDARQIAGALNRLQAMSNAYQRPIDLTFARETLADLVRANSRPVQLADIERAVCDCLGLESSKLQSPQKSKSVAHPRMLAMFLARKHTRAGLAEIGDHFGHRSHTTVVSAEKRVNQWLSKCESLSVEGRTWGIHDAISEIEGRLQVG